jgi:hypothetical protein
MADDASRRTVAEWLPAGVAGGSDRDERYVRDMNLQLAELPAVQWHEVPAHLDAAEATIRELLPRGIDLSVWLTRGCRRYEKGDAGVKEEFRSFPGINPGTVTLVVNQSAGWFIPKHAPPGYPAISPQLRPDDPVNLTQLPTWHYHGPKTDTVPTFPAAAGALAGKDLWRKLLLYGAYAEAHVNAVGEPYDLETGVGRHNGQPVDVVHRHAPASAKYVLLGEGVEDGPKRIDIHPLALRLLPAAKVVFFVLEGTLKADAVLSAGHVAFDVPSVTTWHPRELTIFAESYLRGKTVFVVRDADRPVNLEVQRHALKVRTLLRRLGIDAEICAPPVCKGVDDHLGAGGKVGELVIEGREAPIDQIRAAVQLVESYQRRLSALRVLEDLSLYLPPDGVLKRDLLVVQKLLSIARADRVVSTLEAIELALVVTSGTLTTTQRPHRWRPGQTETVWVDQPTLILREDLRAT